MIFIVLLSFDVKFSSEIQVFLHCSTEIMFSSNSYTNDFWLIIAIPVNTGNDT